MLKEKMKLISRFLLKNSKMVLPILIVFAVAITVLFALKAKDARMQQVEVSQETMTQESEVTVETTADTLTEIALTKNTIPELEELIDKYYEAYAQGDVETIKSVSNYLDQAEGIRISAMSEYVEGYPEKNIYIRPGPIEKSYLVYVHFKMKVTNFEETISGMETFYVCTDADGKLYLNEGEVSDEELAYIKEVATQADVEELRNRVDVECKETISNNEELFYYIQEVVNEVQKNTGEVLADQMDRGPEGDAGEDEVIVPDENQDQNQEEPVNIVPSEPVYAKATTTVNVRVSDSEQADKVDKVTRGTQVEILEQKVNGWSHVKSGNIEGYIKSEFLQLLNTAGNEEVVGTVTALSNVNVRMAPGENADRMGVLAGGETVDLLGRENGWCKINYNGQLGYVKEDFVQ